MALKHILIIFLLFISLQLLPANHNAAIHGSHSSSLDSQHKHKIKMAAFLLTNRAPIPPSGPSKGHDKQPKVGGPVGSARDSDIA
ncbi:hypothetical protein WN944_019629 [Citrus x changshan-huyou]|uniref:Uncharacterized protein n=1 Tax=Citrus x changshan-huyou TaxID=2935761 RepID=A0AAP0LVM6_9ROSI